MVILSKNQAEKLSKYVYKGGDLSPIYKHLLSPLAQLLVDFTPRSVAPNTITLIGLLASASSAIITVVYNPNLSPDGPRWICLVSAVALFVYQTMDNMDGKQARRTGTSSPLGMLFDHGCDAINAGVFPIPLASALGTGWTLGIFFGWWCSFVPFYFQTWEEHHLGQMFLLPMNGPTEGILIGVGICTFSYFYGSLWWQQALDLPPFLATTILDNGVSRRFGVEYVSPFRILVFVAVVGAVITCCVHTYKVCTHVVSTKKKNATLHIVFAIWELAPFLVFFSSSFIWCKYSPSALTQYPLLASLLITSVFVETATHVMLASITASSIQPAARFLAWFTTSLLALNVSYPFLMNTSKNQSPLIEEAFILYPMVTIAVGFTSWKCYQVCVECAEALGIYVFLVEKRSKKK